MADAKLKSKLELNLQISLDLSLEEAKALEQMTVYGHKAFLEVFYKSLGKAYLEPHEKGLISLFTTIKDSLSNRIYEAGEIIKTVENLRK